MPLLYPKYAGCANHLAKNRFSEQVGFQKQGPRPFLPYSHFLDVYVACDRSALPVALLRRPAPTVRPKCVAGRGHITIWRAMAAAPWERGPNDRVREGSVHRLGVL